MPAGAGPGFVVRADACPSADGDWLASNVPAEGFTAPERVQRQRDEMRRMRPRPPSWSTQR